MPLYVVVLWLEHIQNFIFFFQLGPKWRPKSAKGRPKSAKCRQMAPKNFDGTPQLAPKGRSKNYPKTQPDFSSILGAPWRPAGPKMAPKIIHVVPKSHPSASKKGPESIIPRIVLHHWTRTMINETNDKKTPAQKHSFYALLLGSAKI